MTTKLFLLSISITLVSYTTFGQTISQDSIKLLKTQKAAIELSREINQNKLKLSELENRLNREISEKENAADNVQRHADDNEELAEKLSDDPNDKRLARKSHKKARKAKSASKQSRRAAKDVEDIRDRIESLRKRIAKDEAKLEAMPVKVTSPPSSSGSR